MWNTEKRNIWAKVMMLTVMATSGQALAATGKMTRAANQVAIHPLSLATGKINLEYERRLTPWVTLSLSPQLRPLTIHFRDVNFKFRQTNVFASSAGGEVGARIYFRGKALDGAYLNPSIGYNKFYLRESDRAAGSSTDVHVVSGSLRLGHQWIIGKHFAINLAGGVTADHAWGRPLLTGDSAGTERKMSRVHPDAAFGMGVAF